MRSKRLLSTLFVVMFLGFGMQGYAQSETQALADTAAHVLRLVNNYRTTKGLTPFKINLYIMRAAWEHSRDMGTQKIPFGHDEFDHRMIELAKKVHPANAFGENVAYGAKTAQEAMDMWLNSEGHRKNIEGKYSITGVGIVRGKDGNLYFTQIFVYQRKE